jgi:hypothetical protein
MFQFIPWEIPKEFLQLTRRERWNVFGSLAISTPFVVVEVASIISATLSTPLVEFGFEPSDEINGRWLTTTHKGITRWTHFAKGPLASSFG